MSIVKQIKVGVSRKDFCRILLETKEGAFYDIEATTGDCSNEGILKDLETGEFEKVGLFCHKDNPNRFNIAYPEATVLYTAE